MKLIERLRLRSTTCWAAISLIAVLAWGASDPFGIRQRLDWIVQDQFLKRRPPAEVHPDLLQVSIDDFAAERLSKNAQRRQMARAIHQLNQLGAKTVLVDILLFGRGSSEPLNRDDLVDYEGVPVDIAQHMSDLPNRFLEDQMLSASLADLDRVVIPFYLRDDKVGPQDKATRAILDAMADRLEQDTSLDVTELAVELNIKDLNVATRLYEQASEIVAERAAREIARDPKLKEMLVLLERSLLDYQGAWTPELLATELQIDLQTANRLFDSAFSLALDRSLRNPNHVKQRIEAVPSAVALRVPAAFDRGSVLRRVRAIGTFALPTQTMFEKNFDLEVPLSDFADDAVLGFADFRPDSDGMFRRMALVSRWNDRSVSHQSLAVLAMHLGVKLSDIRLEKGKIHIDSEHVVPVDSSGRLSINWPMNREASSHEKIPRLSLGDLLEVYKYEADLMKNRHNLRLNVALLDNELDLGFDDDDKCDILLNAIYEDYIAARIDAAREKERRFDNEYLPKALKHEKAQAILARVKRTPLEGADADNQAMVSAQSIIAIQREIERVAKARHDQIQPLRKMVEGKLCLIGDTTTAGEDLKGTPVRAEVPGVTIIFSAINTMLTGRYLFTPGLLSAVILTIVFAGGFSWVFQRTPAKWSFAAMSVGLLLIFYGHYQALAQADTLASPVLPMSGVFACFLVITTRRWWNDVREKQKVREVFQHYLHPAMVDKLTSHPELVRLGGEDADLSILFADIRGFSGIAEKLTAEQLQKYLNGFFTPMSRIAQDHGGTIDKYIGDEMMVFYGAPLEMQDHATQAVLTAIKMIERLTSLQKEWSEQGLPDIHIGIGINTDIVRVGNFGSDDKFDYTVIGDGVNLASRLQGTTKQYGVQVIVGAKTWKRLGNRIAGREIDRILVQGKLKPTRIFNPVGVPPLDETQQRFLDQFNAGIAAFQDRRWQDALALFRETQAIDGDDRPSQIYIERCEKYMATPPPANWSGVTTMTVK